MKTTLTSWILTGAIAIGVGCTAPTTARAKEPAPDAPEAEARIRVDVERAARDAARAGRDAARQAERELETLQGRLYRLRDGQGLAALRAAGQLKKEKAAYLGVTTSPVSGALREHLKLPRGFGLVVDSIGADSPAAEAGVQRFDILQKLDDQLLVNTQQLSVLIRSREPGSPVRLTLLRGGQVQELTATLGEKEVPVLSDGSWAGTEDVFGAIGNVIEAPLAPTPPIPPAAGLIIDGAGGAYGGGGVFNWTTSNANTSVFQDTEMTLTIREDEDGKTLVVKDIHGQTLFDGPINDAAQREKLPAEVARKLERFEERLASMPVEKGRGVIIRVIETNK